MTSDPDAPIVPSDLFLSPDLTEERAIGYLAARGFREPAAADRGLQQLADDLAVREALSTLAVDLLDALLRAPDPDAALGGLVRYAGARTSKLALFQYLREDVRAIDALAHVLGASPFLTEILVRNPEYFHWLVQQLERSAPDRQAYDEELDGILDSADGPEAQLDGLRRFKRREILRIAARDILGHETLESATAQLTELADLLVSRSLDLAWEQCLQDLSERPGRFAVIAVGKLGGLELNYSSDVDLLYVYEPLEADEATSRQFFERLGLKLTATISEHTSEGYLYRVDLGLRPMGMPESVVYSITQCQQYYAASGETLERFALIKARPIAGDPDLGERFIGLVRPFVYGTRLDGAAIGELRHYQTRTASASDRNVKLGRGGIREVELFAQGMQLTHGIEQEELREPNTLLALSALARIGRVPPDVIDSLTRAYVLLRTIEHRLQLVQDTATHSLPENDEELEICARRVGFGSGAELIGELQRHRDRVHTFYANLFDQR